jgi:hypothetical protein
MEPTRNRYPRRDYDPLGDGASPGSPRRTALALAFLLAGSLALSAPPPAAAGSAPEGAAAELVVSRGAVATCPARHTQGEIDAVVNAAFAWVIDQVGRLGPPPFGLCQSVTGDVSLVPTISAGDLAGLLVPDYIAAVPTLDGWGNPYDYRLDVGDPFTPPFLAVRSAGADGAFEGTVYPSGDAPDPDADLVELPGLVGRRIPRLDPVSLQERAKLEISAIGSALFAWITDQLGVAGPSLEPSASRLRGTYDVGAVTPISAADLAALLVPNYIACIPEFDPWGTAYDYRLNGDLLGAQVAVIRSAGDDGTFEGDVYPVGGFVPEEFFRDLVWADGLFIRMPTGPRTLIFSDGFESGELWGTWSCSPDF